MQTEISDRFLALAKSPEAPDGLAEGALVLAAEAKIGGVDIDASIEAIKTLAERARPLVEAAATPAGAVTALNHSLFELERFRGNQEEYDDPKNSFLDDVLQTRRGLPISLSVLYVDIARRLGLDAYGIGFPGHFLAKVRLGGIGGPSEIIVDPFFCRTLTPADCAKHLRAAGGEDMGFDPGWLEPASGRDILIRMLNNLKLYYLRTGNFISALGSFDRILLLNPKAATEYRDRGLLLERLDCILPAIEDLGRFLDLAPHDPSSKEIRHRRDALDQRRPILN